MHTERKRFDTGATNMKRGVAAALFLLLSCIEDVHGLGITPSSSPLVSGFCGVPGASRSSISARRLWTVASSDGDGDAENDDWRSNDTQSHLNLGQDILLTSHVNRRSVTSALLTAAMTGTTTSSILLTNPDFAGAVQSSKPRTTVPTWSLPGGVRMPTLALNTVGLSVEDTTRAVRYAVQEAGVTHIDFHPGKERDGVAAYLREGTRPRSGLFLNTKIRKAPPGTSPTEAADRTRTQIREDLEALSLPSVDMLMLRDSPDCDVIQAQWEVLEEALASGKTRSLGVINFCEKALTCLLKTAKVKPALNYYMLHVGMGRDAHGLRSFGESRGIRTFAYGAVGEPGPNEELLSSPILQRIGRAHNNKSPEQVALRWVLQTGAAVSVRPTLDFGLGTSVCRGSDLQCRTGILDRAGSFDWKLTEREMAELDAMARPDDNPTLFSSAGCPGAFVMPK